MSDKHTLTLDYQAAQSRKIKQLTAKHSQCDAELGKALNHLKNLVLASKELQDGKIDRVSALRPVVIFLWKHGKLKYKQLDDMSLVVMEWL